MVDGDRRQFGKMVQFSQLYQIEIMYFRYLITAVSAYFRSLSTKSTMSNREVLLPPTGIYMVNEA